MREFYGCYDMYVKELYGKVDEPQINDRQIDFIKKYIQQEEGFKKDRGEKLCRDKIKRLEKSIDSAREDNIENWKSISDDVISIIVFLIPLLLSTMITIYYFPTNHINGVVNNNEIEFNIELTQAQNKDNLDTGQDRVIEILVYGVLYVIVIFIVRHLLSTKVKKIDIKYKVLKEAAEELLLASEGYASTTGTDPDIC